MCDKSYQEDPRDVVLNAACERGVIADMLQCSAIDPDVLSYIRPGDLGIFLSGLRDRLTAASTALDDASAKASRQPRGSG